MEAKLSGGKPDIGIVPARMFALDAPQLPAHGFTFEGITGWPQCSLSSALEPPQVAAVLPH